MPRFPQVKPREAQKVLAKLGFILKRSEGSHFRYHHQDGRRVTVAFHNVPLKKGTLKSVLRQINISVEEFSKLL